MFRVEFSLLVLVHGLVTLLLHEQRLHQVQEPLHLLQVVDRGLIPDHRADHLDGDVVLLLRLEADKKRVVVLQREDIHDRLVAPERDGEEFLDGGHRVLGEALFALLALDELPAEAEDVVDVFDLLRVAFEGKVVKI